MSLDVWGYYSGTCVWQMTDVGRQMYKYNSFLCYAFLKKHLSLETAQRLEQFEMEINPAYLAWDYLVSNHSTNTKDAALEAQVAMTTIKMKPGESMTQFLRRGQGTRATLAKHGEVMSDEQWIRCMVRRLPTQYKPLKLQAKAMQSKNEVEVIEPMREADSEDEEDDDGDKSTTSSQSASLLQVTSSSVTAVSTSAFKFKARD